MHINEINKITVPTIRTFPYGKLFFDIDNEKKPNIWLEAISIDHTEAREFQRVNDIKPKLDNLMCAAGYLYDENRNEFQVYCIYSYGEHEGEGKVYFLTVILDKNYTFNYTSKQWIIWEN